MNEPHGNRSLPALREQTHPNCFVCGLANGHGLGLEFHLAADGAVEASFACAPAFEGYPGMLHSGVICALLDGAMTNCVFAHGWVGVTVDMKVRFWHPVVVGRPTRCARLDEERSPVYCLTAEVVQGERIAATAAARFMSKQAKSWFGTWKLGK